MSWANTTFPASYENMSTNLSTNSSPVIASDVPLYQLVANWFIVVWAPVLMLAGLFGNVMVIVVQRRGSSSSGISVCFIGLALSDLLFLLTVLLGLWLYETFGVYVYDLSRISCKIGFFLCYFSGKVSSWLLVIMTTSRAISVTWPYRADSLCTPRRFKLAVMIVVVSVAALESHFLFGYDLYFTGDRFVCGFQDPGYYRFQVYAYTFVNILVLALLPFLCLLLSNGVLIWKLTEAVGQARQGLGVSGQDVLKNREKHALSLSVTLIAVSVSFFVFNLPYATLLVYQYYCWVSFNINTYFDPFYRMLLNLTALFLSTNSAVNFYIYLLTGTKFRNEFIAVFASLVVQGQKSTDPLSTTKSSVIVVQSAEL